MLCLPLPLGQTGLFHLSKTLPRNFISQLHASTVDALAESAMRVKKCVKCAYSCPLTGSLQSGYQPQTQVSTWFHYDFCSHEADFKHFCLTVNNREETVLWPCRKKPESWQSQQAQSDGHGARKHNYRSITKWWYRKKWKNICHSPDRALMVFSVLWNQQ